MIIMMADPRCVEIGRESIAHQAVLAELIARHKGAVRNYLSGFEEALEGAGYEKVTTRDFPSPVPEGRSLGETIEAARATISDEYRELGFCGVVYVPVVDLRGFEPALVVYGKR